MNDKQIHERAIHKAESQISFLKIEMSALEQETPYMSFTQEMIEGQQAWKCKEIDTWRYILDCVKIVETKRMIEEEKYIRSGMTAADTPNFETKFGKTTKYK